METQDLAGRHNAPYPRVQGSHIQFRDETNRLLMSPKIAYCTNVHAGASLAQTRENLERYAARVRRQFSPERPMGIGLWLSAGAARGLIDEAAEDQLCQWLSDTGLVPFTFNGFPYGDFHQPVVKEKVYQPTWFDRARLTYTQDLARLLHRLAPAGLEGSISTLPLAWSHPAPTSSQLDTAAHLLGELATDLAHLERETGRLIYLCIEPEPGCWIQRCSDVVEFFQSHLLPQGDESILRRHVRVCHDVCHAVVMCESQRSVLSAYQRAGIEVGKVQVSSAVVVDFDQIDPLDRQAAHAQLTSFAEDRYLHQTTIQRQDAELQFFRDLPEALQSVGDGSQASGVWRVHFHIPVYLQQFGWLRTSQADIIECLQCCPETTGVQHFEVETYAWNVLPAELQHDDLAAGIVEEMQWFSDLADQHLP